ncbi:MAG: hypothetical protein DI586_08815 [Micavibrio aeruginosavorus]|uniref:Uncharacterized protein n=1 Tax=Micavibrio aeruginosavorus TaxID=349221 RepID=A0A2W5HLX6_9BACT|nr:MAG: hypothetical protein DI586_08815 [Micavibrio aeruginosavorus]
MNIRAIFFPSSRQVFSEKDLLIERLHRLRSTGQISLLDACMEIGRFVHRGEPRKTGGDYFTEHNMRMMNEDARELRFDLTDFQRALIAVHDVPEKKFKLNPEYNWSRGQLFRATHDEHLVRSAFTMKKETFYFPYHRNVCLDGQEDEIIVKTLDNYNNKNSNPSAEKAKIYDITIAYGLARLNRAIPENYDHAIFAAEIGMYDRELFEKHGPDSAIIMPKPSNDRSPL